MNKQIRKLTLDALDRAAKDLAAVRIRLEDSTSTSSLAMRLDVAKAEMKLSTLYDDIYPDFEDYDDETEDELGDEVDYADVDDDVFPKPE